jgi:geranylgeranyl pyrophosphate synthase
VPSAVDTRPENTDARLDTSALKGIPEARAQRDRIRAAAAAQGRTLDRSRPLSWNRLKELGEVLLQQLSLGENYLGFTMVAISNEFWRDQFQTVPFSRRLLLLPHCLRDSQDCPAEFVGLGLDCQTCGSCAIAGFKTRAENLGYSVLVSEGTPLVLKTIVSGQVDGIIGVACLNVLEKALDKVLLAGIPCVAVPLLSCQCRDTSVDDDWVWTLIELQAAAQRPPTPSYVHMMRAAHQICEEPELSRLAPPVRSPVKGEQFKGNGSQGLPAPNGTSDTWPSPLDPLAQQEAIAYDWLAQGGKRSRPFITLAAYDALRGGRGTLGIKEIVFPEAVKRVALAIEVFHKASLVHDDIEDDDTFRYGRATLHRQYGVGPAINVGDYLIGLGYRLVSQGRRELGGDCTADILHRLATAHLKLAEGQGAELLWRASCQKELTPLDALRIYALKTAPAFEAALYAGLRLASPADRFDPLIGQFSRNLGIAFQIVNDLKDWEGDGDNKLVAGSDVLAARPTLLLALALEASEPVQRDELLGLIEKCKARAAQSAATPDLIDLEGKMLVENIGRLFAQTQVFAKAHALVDKYHSRALALAAPVEPMELRDLLSFLVEAVLHGREVTPPKTERWPVLRTGSFK